MKVTNGDIWQAREPLKEILKEVWPVKTAYWLVKLGRKIEQEWQAIEQVKNRLIEQYGTRDERGMASISRESPNWSVFVPAFNELMAQEVEIPIDRIILPEVDGLQLAPATLMALEPFVELPEPAAEVA